MSGAKIDPTIWVITMGGAASITTVKDFTYDVSELDSLDTLGE